MGKPIEGAIVMDPAPCAAETSCVYGAAGKPAEPHGEGSYSTLSVDCVMTVNTLLEHGVIRGTPLTD